MAARKNTEIVYITKPKIAQLQAAEGLDSELEATLLFHIRTSKILPEPVAHYQFALEYGREYEADFAYPEQGILIECEGGIFTHERGTFTTKTGKTVSKKSRHLTPKGYTDDCDKYNFAQFIGFTVIRFTIAQIESAQALTDLELFYQSLTQHNPVIEAGIQRGFGRVQKVIDITRPRTGRRAARSSTLHPLGGAS